ncbi:MAG: UDP-glucose 4-epimerase GalE [Cyclobacteriaceae bacterium]
MKGKIIVTGGCGYIGSHTITEMIEHTDYDVVSIDNNCNSSIKAMSRIEEITGKEVKNYVVDLCDDNAARKAFEENKDAVAVIHFAALKAVGESVDIPLEYYRNNLNSLSNVLKFTNEFGIKNLIFSSSCSLYGDVDQLPVSEQTPLNLPESPYANTKKIGEEIIKDYVKVSNINAISLRYFNPVGAHASGKMGEDPINKPNNLVPIVTGVASGKMEKLTVFGDDYNTKDGSCVRDYIHVTDIAKAHVEAVSYLLAGKQKQGYDVFNLGTGNGVTVLELIKAFEKTTGVSLNYEIGPRRAGDVVAVYSDNTKVSKYLGWKPERGIDNMMESAWKWQQYVNKE